MVESSRTFALSMALTLAGLAVMLYGVSLTSGQSANLPMILGGAIIVVAIGMLANGIMNLDGGETEAH